MTVHSLAGWLELGVFVALAVAATERWRRRRDEAAAWLAVTFALLGGVLLGERFLPESVKAWGGYWFDRAILVDLAVFPYCLYRFTASFSAASRAPRRLGVPAVATAVLVAAALALPDVPGGSPASWPWWYAAYIAAFLVLWTTLSLVSVARLWRCGRGQPSVARQRMTMLATAAVVLNVTIFMVADGGHHEYAGAWSGLLFLMGFAPPPALRARWRRPELESFRRAEADLMSADTAERVIGLMLPHAARLVGGQNAVLVDQDGRIRACHGTTAAEAAEITARLRVGAGAGGARAVHPDLVAVRVGSGWIVVATTESTPFFGDEEIRLLQTLAHLAGLALDRAELYDRERVARQVLAERESQLAEAQRTARLGSYRWDLRSGDVSWSDEMHRLLGFVPGQVTNHGEAFSSRVHPDDLDRVVESWSGVRSGTAASSVEYRVVLPAGEVRWIQGRVRVVLDVTGRPVEALGTIQDITERKLAEEAVVFQATHDALTRLPNRALFLDRLGQALARRTRRSSGVAVLFLDVDRFKWLNDSLGHAAGDELLVTVADRLREAMRAEDSVARFGGDEFVVLCEDVVDKAEAEALAARVASVVAAPVTIAGDETAVTVSIGIAYAPGSGSGETPESLVRDADAAMYHAKDQGRNRHEVFDAATRDLILARHETVTALRRGIERGELVVHYQPALDLVSGRIVGVEALVRWRHPQRGLLVPGEFMALADETGLVVPLGTDVLMTACRQLAAWDADGRGPADLLLSVNLAARQLLAADLPSILEEALAETALDPSRLCLEITESALLQDDSASTRALDRLRSLGVHIAVDDFGTGFSSLTYLKRFPVDVLKIDRSFVAGMCGDRQDRAIVASVIDLARAFGLRTIAEGIETGEQLTELRALGCEQGQGFLWSGPLPALATVEWMESWTASRFEGQPTSAAVLTRG